MSCYYRVLFDYEINPRARNGIKVTREVISRFHREETTKVKAKKIIRNVSRKVIPTEYLVNPKISNRF